MENYLYLNKTVFSNSQKVFFKEDFIYKKLIEQDYLFINNAFYNAHDNLKYSNYDVNFSGTTLNVVFMVSGKIICASVGDSRSILIKNDFSTESLSIDHKPDDELEKERIEKMGGVVAKLSGNEFNFK
jgi:serine/threonine protein phosphatase PrpC